MFAKRRVYWEKINQIVIPNNQIAVSCGKNKIMAIFKLSPIKKELDLEKGDQITYTYSEHLSVGVTADFEIENALVLKHLETDTAYLNPEKMEEGMTGGDAANTTFVFEAISEGTTLLIIRKYFRSELEEEYTFRINVS